MLRYRVQVLIDEAGYAVNWSVTTVKLWELDGIYVSPELPFATTPEEAFLMAASRCPMQSRLFDVPPAASAFPTS